jgi:hypothetical protein
MRGGRQGFGRDWRCIALRLATLASASFPATTPRELVFSPILLFLALLIYYNYWKCLRDIGAEGIEAMSQACVSWSATM